MFIHPIRCPQKEIIQNIIKVIININIVFFTIRQKKSANVIQISDIDFLTHIPFYGKIAFNLDGSEELSTPCIYDTFAQDHH